MSAIISQRQIDDYRQHGVVLLRNVLDEQWLSTVAAGVARNLAAPTRRTLEHVWDEASKSRFFYDALTVGENDHYDHLMLHSPLGEVVGRAMGSTSAIAFYISVFVRNQGTANRTPWHQDQPSWSAVGDHACSVWLSVDHVPKKTALEFVRGSHLWQTRYRRPQFFANDYEHDQHDDLTEFPDIEANRADYDIVSWEMSPGDCVLFHGMTVHGGSGNLPESLGRRAVSVQWLGDDARFRLLPGGDDPHISEEVLKYGLQVGDRMTCELCPVVWRAVTA